jgi:hypothetical protein
VRYQKASVVNANGTRAALDLAAAMAQPIETERDAATRDR